MAQVLGRLAYPHYRRDAEAAGQDGGVRHGAAEFGDEPGDPLVAHQDGVGGGQVLGQYDPALEGQVMGLFSRVAAQQCLLDLLHHVVHVVLAGAQVGVVHGIEHPHQLVAAHLQGPFGAAVQLPDQLDGTLGDGRVLQHQQMGVDESGDVGGGVGRDLPAHLVQMLVRCPHRLAKAFGLLLDLVLRDLHRDDLHLAPQQHMGLADGDLARYPDAYAGKGKGHASSPKRSRDQLHQRLAGLGLIRRPPVPASAWFPGWPPASSPP